MNQKQINKREAQKLLNPAFNNKENVIKISKGNTIQHELAKFLVCWELSNTNKDFITEARLKTGHRCDILVPEEFEAIEILYTEKQDNPAKKDYPVNVRILRAIDVINYWKKHM